ncbi:MAG: motility protein A [Acidimicrobiales bacterium]
MTIVGIVLALVTTFGAMTMAGMDPVGIFFGDPGSIVLVFGGAIGATMATGTMPDAINAIKVMVKAFTSGAPPDAAGSIERLVEFADVARRDGLLALESSLAEVDDEFLQRGLMMAVDGTDPEELRDTLELDVDQMATRHRVGAAFFTNAAGFSPAFGVAGTVIGLIDMLNNLSDPSALGPSLAVAFVTTLWGVLLANYMFAPIAMKLKRASAIELAYRELLVEGILAIQAGSNPRALAGKLATYLPPAEREAITGEKKSA